MIAHLIICSIVRGNTDIIMKIIMILVAIITGIITTTMTIAIIIRQHQFILFYYF